jgi:two-component system phosphate regulon sensor histidine kinase PhoR
VLPSLIFVIYEVGTLRQNEKVIEDIYNNQLDALLFSINQYSEDVVSSWANQINNQQNYNDIPQTELDVLIREMPSVKAIFQYDSAYHLMAKTATVNGTLSENDIDSVLNRQKDIVQRLFTYVAGGYRKIESFNLTNGSQLLVFVTSVKELPVINALILDPRAFINQVLDPKIQEIAGERFFIAAFYQSDDNLIYSSNKQRFPERIEHRKAFWVLDDYLLGIELRDRTISDLAWERSRKDLIMIGVVQVVLLIGVFVIYRNVKKQMELAQIKSDFVSNVSHEIRTPLALISMYIESLERGMVKTPEKIREYYSISLQETQRLTAIVNKILNFSQIESGKRSFTYHNVDLKETAEEALSMFRLNLENREFEWSFKAMEEDLHIIADKEAVADAIINLIDNAIKYSDAVKKIDVHIGREKDHVFAEVRDHGLGISKSDQRHIFDKFYRVTNQNLAHKAKGSGIGLAIVKHIMDAHEGYITLNSKPGEGSAFRLYFPKIKTSIP